MNQHDPAERAARAQAQELQMDTLIGYVLLSGVVASMVLIVIGLAWHWVSSGHLNINYLIPRANLFEFMMLELHEVASGVLRPQVLVSLGIATLLLTPYVRVLASLLFFVLVEHNWKYSLFTGFVLAVLTYSLFLR